MKDNPILGRRLQDLGLHLATVQKILEQTEFKESLKPDTFGKRLRENDDTSDEPPSKKSRLGVKKIVKKRKDNGTPYVLTESNEPKTSRETENNEPTTSGGLNTIISQLVDEVTSNEDEDEESLVSSESDDSVSESINQSSESELSNEEDQKDIELNTDLNIQRDKKRLSKSSTRSSLDSGRHSRYSGDETSDASIPPAQTRLNNSKITKHQTSKSNNQVNVKSSKLPIVLPSRIDPITGKKKRGAYSKAELMEIQRIQSAQDDNHESQSPIANRTRSRSRSRSCTRDSDEDIVSRKTNSNRSKSHRPRQTNSNQRKTSTQSSSSSQNAQTSKSTSSSKLKRMNTFDI